MAIRGKRADRIEAIQYPPLQAGERAELTRGEETIYGRIKTVKDGFIYFRVDQEPWQIEKKELGDLLKIPMSSRSTVTHQMCKGPNCTNKATKKDSLCDVCRAGAESEAIDQEAPKSGFEQFGVSWDPQHIGFALKPYGEKISFYGWYRKMRNERSSEIFHCIDLFAKTQHGEYTIESIQYTTDPRENLRSLNADICAATNKWWFQKLGGKAENLDDILKQAKKPSVYINHLATIDNLLIKLREYRDTAIRAGGERHFEIRGDTGHPPVLLTLNLTTQAIALEGKVPTLYAGAIYDAARSDHDGSRGRPLEKKADPENVKILINQLERARKSKDKKTARSIRAQLREMGWRGGGRAAAREGLNPGEE